MPPHMHIMNGPYTNISLEAMPSSGHRKGMAQPSQMHIALSERAKTLPGSAIRALLSSARSNVALDLGGGIPEPDLFPGPLLVDVFSHLIATDAAQALQYAPTEGLLPLRARIAQRLQQRGCSVTPEQVIITHGSQQALAAAAALLTSPTEPVALELPVYPGARQAFALAEAPSVPLPVTEQGWEMAALKRARVAVIYVNPSYQNPTGRSANIEQRRLLAEYAEATETFVVEDDAYGELGFDAAPTRPILADAPTRGILVGTFSKTLCPGLRVGWIVVPRGLVEPLVRILQASSLQPGTLTQHLAFGLLERLDWQAHLGRLRCCYQTRAFALHARCHELGLHAAAPKGGFFLWVRTRGAASRVAAVAAAHGVLTVPERAFQHSVDAGPDRHLRLAFSRFRDIPGDLEKLATALGSGSVL